ncbi:hypothetical protein MMAN_18350 [Mycobacterium mantenii]|uniref:Uncharacterized protein n=1 Tax=Mycobacterium mantenii TaxID=560555 RepID=A0ABM7JRT4_MYCNT|nr:hypothetical protein MMAN_18350 [Mycobacterium mantenii]
MFAKSEAATVGGRAVVLGVAVRAAGLSDRLTTAKTPTTTTITAYDSTIPTKARSRPRCPVRRTCRRPKCPRIAPTGANTNANTTDNVAKVLTGRRSGGGVGGAEYTGGPGGALPNGVSPNGLC